MPLAEETTGSKLKKRRQFGDRALGDSDGRVRDPNDFPEVVGYCHAEQTPNALPPTDEETRATGMVPLMRKGR